MRLAFFLKYYLVISFLAIAPTLIADHLHEQHLPPEQRVSFPLSWGHSVLRDASGASSLVFDPLLAFSNYLDSSLKWASYINAVATATSLLGWLAFWRKPDTRHRLEPYLRAALWSMPAIPVGVLVLQWLLIPNLGG